MAPRSSTLKFMLCVFLLIEVSLPCFGITRLPCKMAAAFEIMLQGMADGGTVGNTTMAATERACSLNCISWPKCKSLNFKKAIRKCELLERNFNQSATHLVQEAGSVYMTTNEQKGKLGPICRKLSPCRVGSICEDTCDAIGYKCTCDQFHYGTRCEKTLQGCTDVALSGKTKSGVYTIMPNATYKPSVFCDLSATNLGWIVFQRRVDGTVDFYRNWADYKAGFGDINGNYWMGLDKLHALAGPGRRKVLRIDLKDYSLGSSSYHAAYYSFEIGDEASGYQLRVSQYSGNAGDSLVNHNGMKFSTPDRDNDAYSSHCAQTWKGAWWYFSCHNSNLNGWYPPGVTNDAKYMTWYSLTSKSGNIFFSEMKLRYYP